MFQTDGPCTVERILAGSGGKISIEICGGKRLKLNPEDFARFDIYPGCSLSEETLAELTQAEKISEAYAKTLHFLSFRSRSRKEVERKLFGYDRPVVEEVISRLSSAGLIDDRLFSRRWIEDRSDLKGLGRRRLFSELLQKGIDREVIEEELEQLPHDLERAKRVAATRLERLNRGGTEADDSFKNRIFSLLIRKGYDSGIARKAVLEVFKDGIEKV